MQFKINLSDMKLLISVVEDADLIVRLHESENAGEYFEKYYRPRHFGLFVVIFQRKPDPLFSTDCHA